MSKARHSVNNYQTELVKHFVLVELNGVQENVDRYILNRMYVADDKIFFSIKIRVLFKTKNIKIWKGK